MPAGCVILLIDVAIGVAFGLVILSPAPPEGRGITMCGIGIVWLISIAYSILDVLTNREN